MRKGHLYRHMKVHNNGIPCTKCGKIIRTDKMLRHTTLCKDDVNEDLCTRKYHPSRSSVQVYDNVTFPESTCRQGMRTYCEHENLF